METCDTVYQQICDRLELDPNNGDVYFMIGKILRDQGKEFWKESQVNYLKALDLFQTNTEINGSYAYLLHLMGEDKDAKKHIDIRMNTDGVCIDHWDWCYYGLIYDEKKEESLRKCVDLIMTQPEYQDAVKSTQKLMKAATRRLDYYERLITMLKKQFEE